MTIDEVQYLDWQWVEENPQTALCLMLELHRENAALREDKERMDWLGQSQLVSTTHSRIFATPQSLRAAIDAARAKEGQP